MNYSKLIIHLSLDLLTVFLYKIARVKKYVIEEVQGWIFKTNNKNLKLHRTKIFFLAVILLTISLPQNSLALTDQERAVQEDIQAKQIIESERRNIIRQKESEEIKNIGKAKEGIEVVKSIDKNLDDKSCRVIKIFEISGNNAIYSWTIKRKFVEPLQRSKKPSLLSKVDLKKLHHQITNYYLKKGYVLNRAYLDYLEGYKLFEFVKPLSDDSSKQTSGIIISESISGSCFTKSDLIKLDDQIAKYYQQQGYVLARVYFDTSELSSGLLKIIIDEGKLEKLEILDNSNLNKVLPFRRSTERFFAFPSLWKDSEINIRDIEQGLDQINRLNSQKAKMDFVPGSKAGYSNVIIENQIGHQATVSLSTDNSGQQRTGRIKRKASLNYDNLLGLNDNIYLNYSESNGTPLFGSSEGFNNTIGTDDNSNNRFSKAFYAATSIPFGYWTIGTSYSYSNYLLTTSGTLTKLQTSGNSESTSYYLDRVLSRGQKYKISLKGELAKSDTDSYLMSAYIPVNSRRTTEANFSLNNVFYMPPYGSINIQPKYSKGLTAFGAMKDPSGLSKNSPHAQFETYGLYAQSNINFKLPKTTIPLNHKLTFDSVKSNDSLYGSDQFTLGGRYSLRGFQESIISGDSGYSVKNDLTVRLSDLFTPPSPRNLQTASANATTFPLNRGNAYSLLHSAISKLHLGLFHDFGYVRNHMIDGSNDEGYMSGAGTALSFNGKFINWDVTYSKGLHSPQYLRNLDNLSKDNETIYFSLSFNLGLL